MVLRLQGVVLFLFIPLVLWLMLAQPVHPLGALLTAVALMFAHRFIAVPYMEKNLEYRCLWCGQEIAPGCRYRVVSSGVERAFNFYIDGMRDKAARFLTYAQKFALPLRVLILGTLAYYVIAEILRLAGVSAMPSHETNSLVFRGIIGLTTLTTFIAYRFVEGIPHMKGPVKFPFPIHNLFLLGIFWTLLIFGAVGAWWVVDVVRTLIAMR
jgi:hypothetical protein